MSSLQPRNALHLWLAGARPRTLPAAIVPVAVGLGAARGAGLVINWWAGLAALVVSVALQVGVNYANDYSDGVKGSDDERVGPTRLVASGLATPQAVKYASFASFGVAGVVGLVLAAFSSWWLLLVGVAAILAAWGYTGGPKPYGYLGLGEVFVFVFFGLVATVGTTYVAAGTVPAITWAGASGVGCMACALLVVNNLRDIPTDRAVGKRTLAVRIGERWTRRLYAALVVGASCIAVGCAGVRPACLAALVGLVVANPALAAVRNGASGAALIPVLGQTGQAQLVYGIVFAVGLGTSL